MLERPGTARTPRWEPVVLVGDGTESDENLRVSRELTEWPDSSPRVSAQRRR